MYVLLIDKTDDDDRPDVHGPFETLHDAQTYAEAFRRGSAELAPYAKTTVENAAEWERLCWWFGIYEPQIQDLPAIRRAELSVVPTTELEFDR